MCVIAFSPKGVDIPTVNQIKQMWQHNPDGAGYAYVGKSGKVIYRKGFMTLDSLLKELEAPERFKNTNFAVHFRIGTSGENDGATCHPFPVSNNFGELRKTEGEVDSVLFHNGILSDGGLASPLASDTQDFVIAMSPLLQKFNRSKTRDYFISELTKGSRLLILYKNNAFKMFGEWQKDGDIWVSNLNYKHDYSWYGSGYYGYYNYMYDDYYDDYYQPKLTDASEKKKPENKVVSEEAAEIWANVIKSEYAFITEEQLQLLKDSSDDYTREYIELDGYVLGYDTRQLLVWVEETPPVLEETTGNEKEE